MHFWDVALVSGYENLEGQIVKPLDEAAGRQQRGPLGTTVHRGAARQGEAHRQPLYAISHKDKWWAMPGTNRVTYFLRGTVSYCMILNGKWYGNIWMIFIQGRLKALSELLLGSNMRFAGYEMLVSVKESTTAANQTPFKRLHKPCLPNHHSLDAAANLQEL